MGQFILIDHSIKDIGGHHYEYAVRVLEAAGRAGYKPVLAANRRFNACMSLPWDVHPVYRHGFWVQLQDPLLYRFYKAVDGWLRQSLTQLKAALVFSPMGLLWLKSSQPGDLIRNMRTISPVQIALFVLLYLLNGAFRLLHLLRLLVPFRSYWKDVGGALRQLRVGLGRQFSALLRPPKWLLEKIANQRKMSAFAADTGRLFRRLRVQEGDIIFIPTLAEAEMLGLLSFFKREEDARLPSWHLLFRRNIYTGREPDYGAQDESQRLLKNTFRYFQQNLDGQTVRFYTDTDPLTAQYNRLGVVDFHTLPVPVSLDYHQSGLPRASSGPLRVHYVGDARTEKGYHHLPRLIQDLWAGYVNRDRLCFHLQSNFNVSRGEPAAVIARRQIEAFPPGGVSLLQESLSTEAYRDFVLAADIILILYDHDRYYARSSGIFVEALMAGKPVVVPAGTWMALQLARVGADYHAALRQSVHLMETRTQAELLLDPRSHRFPGNDEITIPGTAWRHASLVLPSDATHALFSFQQGEEQEGRFMRLTADQLDQEGCLLDRTETAAGGGQPGSLLLPLHPQALKIRLALRNAWSADPLILSSLKIDLLQAGRALPLSAVGMIYSKPEDISTCVTELVEHYDHYSQTAQDFSKQAAAYFTPDGLVENLVSMAADGSITHFPARCEGKE